MYPGGERSGVLLVDTYNVLQTSGVLPSHLAGIELDGLARLLTASRYARGRRVLVCDGRPHSAALMNRAGKPLERDRGRLVLHGSEVLFAGAGNEADAVIERLLEVDSAPGRLTVVSSDRRVRRAAGRAGSKVLGSGEFLEQLAADHARPPREADPPWADEIPLDAYSINVWMRELGVADDLEDAADRAASAQSLPEMARLPEPRAAEDTGAGASARGSAGPSASDRFWTEVGAREKPGGRKKKVEGKKRADVSPEANVPRAGGAEGSGGSDAGLGPGLGAGLEAGATFGLSDPELIKMLRTWPGLVEPGELDMAAWLARETRGGRGEIR